MASQLSRYSYGAILLHWIMAILIITLLVMGLVMVNLPDDNPQKYKLFYPLHKATGLTVLLLSFVRLGWRFTHPAPPLPAAMPCWETFASRLTHWVFYGLMLGLPLSGWAMSSAGGHPISFFGLFEWPSFPGLGQFSEAMREGLGGVFSETHKILAYMTIGLLVLHIAAALKHYLFDRDDVLYRMTLLFKPRNKKE